MIMYFIAYSVLSCGYQASVSASRRRQALSMVTILMQLSTTCSARSQLPFTTLQPHNAIVMLLSTWSTSLTAATQAITCCEWLCRKHFTASVIIMCCKWRVLQCHYLVCVTGRTPRCGVTWPQRHSFWMWWGRGLLHWTSRAARPYLRPVRRN